MIVASPLDLRELARRRLPHFLFEYIDGSAGSELTARRNLEDLERIVLRQRVMRDVSRCELGVTLFGQACAMPVALGPIGLAGLAARRGECQAVRAATAAGIPFCLSTVSVCALDEVALAATQPFWFQLYMIRDRAFMSDLLSRAREANCSALVFTVDMPLPGTRYRDLRSGLAGAPGIRGLVRRFSQAARRPRWALDVGLCGRPHHLGNVAPVLKGQTGLNDFMAWMRSNFDPTVTWTDIEWVRSQWKGPLIIKGILDPRDARDAVSAGADGVIVSNHGGRQLDGTLSSAAALPAIVDAIGSAATVMADGGIRTGLDVVRMLSLGARAVLLGRAWIYALGAGGEPRVVQLLKLIEAEMRVALALTGTTNVSELGRHILC